MTNAVIRIEHLGKAFHRAQRPVATRLMDEVAGWLRSGLRSSFDEQFWALQDVSLDIQAGEIVGLIGHNGAGKSTLLKLLCRILHPTAGRIELRGRVGSLLEVGTGFHPELTGRENISLNGAILGMSRREIAARFNEIVAFSEVEPFLDMPVKRYSSGMAVRLAFAVAAHLEPEILLIDEVLAVGDFSFQKKCLGRLQDLSQREGRTVLLVSHNAAALAALCQRGIVIDRGRVRYDGGIHEALQQYLGGHEAQAGTEWEGPSGDEHLRLVRAWVRPADGGSGWDTGSALEIGTTVDVLQAVEGLVFGVRLLSEFGAELAYVQFDDAEAGLPPAASPGRFHQVWTIPANTLAAGRYRLSFELGLAHRQVSHKRPEGDLTFSVENLTGRGRRFPMSGVRGYNSLFRPDWPTQHRRESLPDDRA